MRVPKASATMALGACLLAACSSPETTNRNASAPTAAANANAGQAVAILPDNATSSAASPDAGKAASSIDAAKLYAAQKCVTCHGPDGKGKVKGAANFTDAAWQQKETDASLTEAIKKGNPPKMPAFEKKLSEEEIKALVVYIRAFKSK